MPRPATGSVMERTSKAGGVTYALRFRAYGKREYVTLGTKGAGWTKAKAEAELRHVLADVERGLWKPAEPVVVEAPAETPTFHVFASEWFEENRHGWADRTTKDYEWALSHHLLPHFRDYRLTAITIAEVDAYKAKKLREADLAPAQINKTLKRLSQILEIAEERELIPRNPARGSRRRAKVPKVQRSWVEPEQALALLEGGSTYMRPVIATLLGSGLRVGEAVALDWSDVNLATGTIKVGKAKTDAGSYREVDLPGGVVDELRRWRAWALDKELALWKKQGGKGEPLFLSKHAGKVRRQTEANVARRLKTAIKRANEQLEELGIEPISDRVTPHSLRRSYASLRAALRDDPVYTAEQMGHTDARFTLSVYAKATKRRSKLSGAYLAEFDGALAWAALPTSEWALSGTNAHSEQLEATGR